MSLTAELWQDSGVNSERHQETTESGGFSRQSQQELKKKTKKNKLK